MNDIKDITIIHLNPDEKIKLELENYYKNNYPNAELEICDLSNIHIKNCVGCWNCWVKRQDVVYTMMKWNHIIV